MGDVTSTRPVTIRDVARAAQVSMTTVSHALSAKRPVSAEAAGRIQAAVQHLGYVPRSAARSLQSGRTLLLGLVVPDVSDPFFGKLAVSVERAAARGTYGVVLSSSIAGPEQDGRYLDLLRSRSIDGLIYVPGRLRFDPRLAEVASTFPVVLADESVPGLEGVPLVAADHAEGGRLAAEHLQQLGHRDVAVLAGPRGLRSADERVAGFLSVVPDAVVVDGDFREETAYRHTMALLLGARPPTAVFASNDVSAFGVVDAARSRGLSVPQDLSVVGFDDVPLARRLSPGLTTVSQPVDEIGRIAFATLLAGIDGTVVPAPPRLPVTLVVRGSTAAR